MFKVNQSTTFWWPAIIEMPHDGEYSRYKIDVQFERPPKAEVEDISDTDETIKRIVRGWKKVADEDGNEIPFTEEKLVDLLNSGDGPLLRFAILRAYNEALMGKQGKRGN